MQAKSTMRRERGFTLIELLVVFAIMALVIGLVPAAFERLSESAKYRDTVRTMLSELRQARSIALSQGREVRFAVDLSGHAFGLQGATPHRLAPALRIRATVAERELQRGVAAIRFLPDGGATGGSIEIIRPAGNGVRLRVDWLSGHVSQEPLLQ
uniref:GspH/FimT family pseudopilin n=2 Tax=Verminephrobacter eiseniae TaxID=364317 RepID=UPI002AA2AC98|nr:GspH/FimT family pseudopilin [Verminephrobacter eiseniae]